MAELPRYRRDGLLTAVAPQIQGVGLQESARSSQALSQSMDRVANFALKRMEQRAKVEGMQYGAAMAPTFEQLAKAKSDGQDIQDLLPGDQLTIFGSNARAVAIELMSSNMEAEALESVTALKTGFEAGAIDLAQLQAGLVDIEDGYSSILSEVSPGAAAKFRASIGATGNAAFLAAAKKQIEADKKKYEISQISRIDMSINGVRTIFDAGPRINEQGEMITPEDTIDVMREQILQAATKLEDPNFAATYLAKLDAKIETAQLGVVIDALQANPSLGQPALNGEIRLADPAAQYILDEASPEFKGVIFRELNAVMSTKFSLDAAAEREREQGRKVESEKLSAEFSNLFFNNQRTLAWDVLGKLRDVNPSAYESKLQVWTTEAGVDKPQVVRELRSLSLNNALSESAVDNAYVAGNLSNATYSSFITQLQSQKDQSYNAAVQWLKLDRGLPNVPLMNMSVIQRQADQEVAQIQKALIEERQRNPSVDPLAFVKAESARLAEEQGDIANLVLRQEAESRLAELKVLYRLPNASAAEILQKLQGDSRYNPQRKQYAVDKLLPIMIDLESRE
jgi:hypothetical protein